MTEHWVEIYSNQKEINYISPSGIRASVESHPPKLHGILKSTPLPSLTFYGPPRRASRGFAIHVFLVLQMLQFLIYKLLFSYSQLWFCKFICVFWFILNLPLPWDNSLLDGWSFRPMSGCPTQGHPTTIFEKTSVRKTIWDLEFSEHLL